MSTSPAAACCENCGTRLRGPHCHVCAQSAHNPLKSFRHALEDVFESFWHLGGRVSQRRRNLLLAALAAGAAMALAFIGGG